MDNIRQTKYSSKDFKNSNLTLDIKSYSELHNARLNNIQINFVVSQLRRSECDIDNLYKKQYEPKIIMRYFNVEMY